MTKALEVPEDVKKATYEAMAYLVVRCASKLLDDKV
jgi:hypothetical protein